MLANGYWRIFTYKCMHGNSTSCLNNLDNELRLSFSHLLCFHNPEETAECDVGWGSCFDGEEGCLGQEARAVQIGKEWDRLGRVEMIVLWQPQLELRMYNCSDTCDWSRMFHSFYIWIYPGGLVRHFHSSHLLYMLIWPPWPFTWLCYGWMIWSPVDKSIDLFLILLPW